MTRIPLTTIKWIPSWRMIADRYPPIDFFERIADPEEWEELLRLEGLTNPNAKAGIGNISLIPVRDRISGPGTAKILPSFTFLDPNLPGSRFSNSQFGAYYAAKKFKTALAEARFRQERFMLESGIKHPQNVEQATILADIVGKFHDIRNLQNKMPEIYSLEDYSQSQSLAFQLKQKDSYGIVYNSVRDLDGECIAVFRPPVITNAREGETIAFQWNGQSIVGYYQISGYQQLV